MNTVKSLLSQLFPIRLLAIAGMSLVLLACGSIPPNFSSMSEEELHAWNLQQPLMQQVICLEEQTTSSYIRKRRCNTLQQLYNARANADLALGVLDYGRYYNDGIGRGRD
ncbi:MAG: hypothetical protein MRY76_04245 [Pseudomonadales bacterium]|jgi:hypothetical protein|nr:hypothetical protein [Pseudomonadales bacterium]